MFLSANQFFSKFSVEACVVDLSDLGAGVRSEVRVRLGEKRDAPFAPFIGLSSDNAREMAAGLLAAAEEADRLEADAATKSGEAA